jgi:hypothetical protein
MHVLKLLFGAILFCLLLIIAIRFWQEILVGLVVLLMAGVFLTGLFSSDARRSSSSQSGPPGWWWAEQAENRREEARAEEWARQEMERAEIRAERAAEQAAWEDYQRNR